jgi:predicted ABC-type ATPase
MNKSAARIIILAGPNGAGKTTFAREFLPNEAECSVFINADLIAAGIAPFAPEQAALRAGKLMLNEIFAQVAKQRSFAFETTLSGLNYVRHIKHWRKLGYRVSLVFLSLPNAQIALSRVAARVAQGGHNIPEKIVQRRFNAGLRNFLEVYKPLVNDWTLFDNQGATPLLIESGDNP